MPKYSYVCGKCGKHFARVESMSAHGRGRVACPKCKSTNVSQEFRSFVAKTSKKS
jgi:putative FmdB family regulatory protein